MSRVYKTGDFDKGYACIRKYSDTGGVWSEDDAKDYGRLYKEILNIQNEYARFETIEKKTEKQKEKLEKLKKGLAETRRKIVEAESSMQSLFDHTADIKAQNSLLLWYTLMLTHIQKEDLDEPVPYFNGLDFDQKDRRLLLKERRCL